MDLANTLRHDGEGGVADELGTPATTVRWLRQWHELMPGGPTDVDGELHARLLGLRTAVRALFAHAVAPGPASRADPRPLMLQGEALAGLNAAATTGPVVAELDWPEEGTPTTRMRPTDTDPRMWPVAALACATIAFLGGPDRERLRACAAPRCVRYFVQGHGRQRWCKPSCGNRVRVARHHRRRQEPRTRPHGGES
ncbi:CGNR zinc finger domain-containing protein [Saccharomonospora iraqiensis]|uniref:CGNR zinc finger domain-containing protein n=1 Tax=Saccharomonospora iraqiensis TaxID=52698 RepID=UPI0002D76A45|nr:CGNR zinc finger domain-containing protein [Saccharomonospora iraqiensis]